MGLLSYSAKDVLLTLGSVAIDGFAEGSMILVEFNENVTNLVIGARGDGVRSFTNNSSAEITIRLMRNAPGNYVLNQMLLEDQGASKSGTRAFFLKDASTGVTMSADSAWVQERPSHDFAMDHVASEWVLATNNMVISYPESMKTNPAVPANPPPTPTP